MLAKVAPFVAETELTPRLLLFTTQRSISALQDTA